MRVRRTVEVLARPRVLLAIRAAARVRLNAIATRASQALFAMNFPDGAWASGPSFRSAKMPSIKTEAATIAMALAQQVGGQAADVQQLLAQVGHDPVKIEIVKAEYGVGTQSRDVTEMLRRQVRDLPLIVLPGSGYNTAFGGDPAPGVVKQLKIQYRINGKPGEATFAENAMILLPMPQ